MTVANTTKLFSRNRLNHCQIDRTGTLCLAQKLNDPAVRQAEEALLLTSAEIETIWQAPYACDGTDAGGQVVGSNTLRNHSGVRTKMN